MYKLAIFIGILTGAITWAITGNLSDGVIAAVIAVVVTVLAAIAAAKLAIRWAKRKAPQMATQAFGLLGGIIKSVDDVMHEEPSKRSTTVRGETVDKPSGDDASGSAAQRHNRNEN